MHFEIFGEAINWPANLVGLLGTIFLLIAYLKKDKLQFTYWTFGAYFSFIGEAVILLVVDKTNVWANIFANILCVVRSIVLVKFLKQGKEMPVWIAMIICGVLWISSAFFFDAWYTYLPPLIVTIFTLSLLSSKFVVGKIGAIALEIGYLTYNFIVKSYVGAIREAVLLICVIISLFTYLLAQKKKSTSLEVEEKKETKNPKGLEKEDQDGE